MRQFEDRKKLSINISNLSNQKHSFLNGPLSSKRKDSSPLSLSPNSSYLKIQPIKTLKQKQNSLKTLLAKPRSPFGKENTTPFKFPVPVDQFIRSHQLQREELNELIDYKQIYYYRPYRQQQQSKDGEFVCSVRDHISYRYEVVRILGSGSFGQVFEVEDHKYKRRVALKMVRNLEKLKKQAAVEANILKFIKEQDTNGTSNIVSIEDAFLFRGHQCLVFEKLDQNLYELLRANRFKGLSLDLIKKISIQVLNSLHFLSKHKIVHCDLKPENILLVENGKSGVRVVDFGSSCFLGQQIYTYIQSRYYRAPEVIFGLKYGLEIDVWSFACLVCELYLGEPIFPGEDEQHQIQMIIDAIGPPSLEFAKSCPRRKYFFDEEGQSKRYHSKNPKKLHDLLKSEDQDFLDFLTKCFVWEPQFRLTPLDALKHPWIMQSLPQEIKASHQRFIDSEKAAQRLKDIIVPKQQHKLKIGNLSNLSSEVKPLLSCRYSNKNSIVQNCITSRNNIAQSIQQLLSKQHQRKPSLFQ